MRDEKTNDELKQVEESFKAEIGNNKDGLSTKHAHRVEVQPQKRCGDTEDISSDRSTVADTIPSETLKQEKLEVKDCIHIARRTEEIFAQLQNKNVRCVGMDEDFIKGSDW